MKLRIIILLLIATNSLAQNCEVKGIVTVKESGTTIENVVVSIDKINIQTQTDEFGRYNFKSLKAGNYFLNFNKIGCASKTINILLTDNEVKVVNIELQSNSLPLNDVNVAADKPVSAASSKYISAIDFENRPKNSAQDMLRLVPGLFIAQHAGGGKAEQIFVRGFDCDHGTDVATFVDGIPVNMPSHGHGQGYEDLHFLIPETVKGMDVFKGPYSPKYGNFATGAAVQFKTVDSLDHNLIQFETSAVPTAKNITSTRGLALMQLPQVANNVNSYFAVDVINNRGYFESDQNFKRVSLFSKTTIAVNEKSYFNLSIGGFGSSWNASGQIPERAISDGIINRFGSIDNTEGGTTQRNNFSLVYHTQKDASEFEVQVYSCNYRFKLLSNFTFFLENSINGDMIEQGDIRNIKGLNASYSFRHKLGTMNNKFIIGTNYRADDIENQLWKAPRRTRSEAQALALIHERSTAIFANEIFRFNDHFRIELGGRFDYFIFDVEDLLPTDSSHINYSGYNYQTLLSPKVNMIYTPNERLQFFLNAGRGFHSNDARSVVQEVNNHQLPKAEGAEIGTLFHLGRSFVATIALWWLDVENELVFVGDDGTTEDKGSSRRRGIDISARYQITNWLFADADLNLSKNAFTEKIYGPQLKTDYYIPLAPTATSAGGLTAKLKSGFEVAARYRFLNARPANESNTIIARGYNVFDLSTSYKTKKYKIGLTIENVTNTEWNEAQFDTESRLQNETTSVDELHFTPGTPFCAKIILGYIF